MPDLTRFSGFGSGSAGRDLCSRKTHHGGGGRTMPSDTRRGVAVAGSTFAATLIFISGVFHVLMGLEAVIRSVFFLRASGYLFRWSLTAWGWIHMSLGVLLVVCAVFLFARAPWAA